MTADAVRSLVGSVLEGSYRIEGVLGEGGMGAVYAATHLRLEKRVAVKVMARELTANSEALARFRREALVTGGLGHPHIVQVFDFATTPAGEPFLVMEFLEGEDLDRRLRRVRSLPAAGVVHIVKQVASALSAAHGKGIVHRDLKPANIYLLELAGESDFVKVLDFGISKVRSANTKLTRTSSLVGTPNYMSPEQAKGEVDDIDERTDQWALACIAWESLAGEALFRGGNVPSILFQIVHEPPPSLLPKVAGLHPQVEDVLVRALAKNKQNRFASVNDFASAFEAAVSMTAVLPMPNVARTAELSRAKVAAGKSQDERPSTTFTRTSGELDSESAAPPARSRAWVWGIVAAAVATSVAAAFVLLRPGPASQPRVTKPPATSVARPVAPLAPAPAPPTPPAPAKPAAAAAATDPADKPAEVKPEPPPAKSERVAQRKPKKARRGVVVAPATEATTRSPPAPQKPPPVEKARKGTQDQWRLD